MDNLPSKIKGSILALLGLGFSLDTSFFLFCFALKAPRGDFLALFGASIYFLLEALGRAFLMYYTWKAKGASGEEREKKKRFACFFTGVFETFYPIPWLLSVSYSPFLSSSHYAFLSCATIALKFSVEALIALSRFLPYRKKRITMAAESLCSCCASLSLLLCFLFPGLVLKGALPASFLLEEACWVSFLVLFFAQNFFFSLLLLQGKMIERIRKIVSFGVEHSIGNYILVSASGLTILSSSIAAIQEQNPAYGLVGWIYLTLGALRLSSLLWRNSLQKKIHNKKIAKLRESKICLYVGACLLIFSAPFSLGMATVGEIKTSGGVSAILSIQIAYGLFRLALCIKNWIVYRKRKLPFQTAMSCLDFIIAGYVAFALFLLIDGYCHFSWSGPFLLILAFVFFTLILGLGVWMLIFGIVGWKKANQEEYNMKENWNALLPYLDRIRKLRHLISVLNYDLETICPEAGFEEESGLIEDAQSALAGLYKDKDFVEKVRKAKEGGLLNPRQEKVVRLLSEEMDFLEKVDLTQFEKWQKAYSDSNRMWHICKEKNDFRSYLPYWQKCVDAKREEAALRKKDGQTPYDACLGNFEPGESSAHLDSLFASLKDFLVPKIQTTVEAQKKWSVPSFPTYSPEQQKKLAFKLLDLIGYDRKRGALAESLHPFSDCLSKGDARLTCHYDSDFRSNLFTILHEGGHCLEFQGWGSQIYEDHAEMLSSMAICETHSRFYENILGRSSAFAPFLKRICAKTLDPSFLTISDHDFYRSLNLVKPSPIRCDADEMTYSLHIIIRYEIEKDLINGVIQCKDVPGLWRKKYAEYLGYEVKNDKEGCLQDVHWSDGSFGYFPSYALGNLYGAQLLHEMKKDFDVGLSLEKGHFSLIQKWFKLKDWQEDWRDPADWIKTVTGESLNPSYFEEYLNEKFEK